MGHPRCSRPLPGMRLAAGRHWGAYPGRGRGLGRVQHRGHGPAQQTPSWPGYLLSLACASSDPASGPLARRSSGLLRMRGAGFPSHCPGRDCRIPDICTVHPRPGHRCYTLYCRRRPYEIPRIAGTYAIRPSPLRPTDTSGQISRVFCLCGVRLHLMWKVHPSKFLRITH